MFQGLPLTSHLSSSTLSLSLTYRLNTDFSVEEIETLLSSRFVDEDFFRPTVARYRDVPAQPGSLPLASTSPTVRGPAAAPPAAARGMTGLGPLPSYGSLSSRHAYAPATASSGPAAGGGGGAPAAAPSPLSGSPRTANALPAPVPVGVGASGGPSPAPSPRPVTSAPGNNNNDASPASSSPRFAPYAPASAAAAPSTSASATGGTVEPAFISLSRARGASYSAASGAATGGVQRASPLSASPAGQAGGGGGGGFFRRTSMGSSSSGSPIFRPGSYLGGAGGTSALASSSSPASVSGAPVGRQQPLPAAVPVPLGSSPLASTGGGGIGAARPHAVSYGSQGSYTRSGILRASSVGSGASFDEAAGAGAGAGAGGLARRPSSGAAARGLSFGVAGSAARSPGGGVGGVGAGTSGGKGVSRLGTMMAQYDAAALPGGAEPMSGGGVSSASAGERRRFIHEGRAPDDADDIEAFLGMLDSRPDLRASDAVGGSALGRSGAGAGGGGPVTKRDVDEQLRLLRSSVFGFAGPSGSGTSGGGRESPSPPVLFGGSAALSGASGLSPSPRGASGLSSLRRQTSRLSIEEDPAAEAAALAARSPSRERPGVTAVERTPRVATRALHGQGLASPTLSATSGTSTAVPPLPQTMQQQQPSGAGAGMVEPRLLPLPLSSTTSPLASPGGAHPAHHAHAHAHYHHPLLHAATPYTSYPFAALASQPYPPRPYPPAGDTSSADDAAPAETASEPVTIAPMRPASVGERSRRGGGVTQPPTPALDSEHTSAAASIASFDVDADAEGGAGSSSSYRCEEEPVGRLELDDDELEGGEDEPLRGRWGARLGVGEADEEEMARLPHHAHAHVRARTHTARAPTASTGRHSRDATPAAARLGGGSGAGVATAPGSSGAVGYFARGSGGGGASPPEISWMG